MVLLPLPGSDFVISDPKQGAVALAAAKRGSGERGRLVASESPVEEFFIRGRRVLIKRDDKVRRRFVWCVYQKWDSC